MTTLKSQKGKLPVLTASRPASDTIQWEGSHESSPTDSDGPTFDGQSSK